MEYFAVTASLFAVAALKAKASQGPKGLCMTVPEENEETTFFLSEDMASGYALQGNTIVGVFAHAVEGKGALPFIMEDAARRLWDAEWYHMNLDCFEPLAKVYARYGFAETGRVAFDWQYAPEGWQADMGEPAVIFMQAHCGEVMNSAEMLLDRAAA